MCIGYLQGTDAMLLTKLNLSGHGVLPLGNHWDGHGKIVALLKKGDVTAVIGPLHKVLPPFKDDKPTAFDQLLSCKTHEIPVLIMIPSKDYENAARDLLGEAAEFVKLVTPDQIEVELKKIIS